RRRAGRPEGREQVMPKLPRHEASPRRRRRVRRRIVGNAERPRLVVFRSNRGISAQLVDDLEGKTVASASWIQLQGFKGNKVEQAAEVGKLVAEKAKGAGVERVVFDRGGCLYHGRVKALADVASEGGLQFCAQLSPGRRGSSRSASSRSTGWRRSSKAAGGFRSRRSSSSATRSIASASATARLARFRSRSRRRWTTR